MENTERQLELSNEEIKEISNLNRLAADTGDLRQFAEKALIAVKEILHSPSLLLCIVDTAESSTHFFYNGFEGNTLQLIEGISLIQIEPNDGKYSFIPIDQTKIEAEVKIPNLVFYPLHYGDSCIGLIGMVLDKKLTRPELLSFVLDLLAHTVASVSKHSKLEKQLSYLNAYLTVSSMLARSTGLQDVLEIALYSSMEVVQAEAASVLLLDEDKETFIFYQVEGPAKIALMSAKFPADKGIAGHVLQSQQPQVINDVANDPRFYRNFDSESGFITRNMIAIPLTAEEERIGVLEVINKTDTGSFSQDDCLLLNSIAEEISFAIRNAKIFEYVADSYCKQRQGQSSCKGCQRPLGSWTPCTKYRQVDL